jgi:hypothetical protein
MNNDVSDGRCRDFVSAAGRGALCVLCGSAFVLSGLTPV